MEFTQKQVAEITKVKDGTIQAWARDGLIIPSIANTKGRGTSRLYSPADLINIAVIKILSEMSFNRDLIVFVLQRLLITTLKGSDVVIEIGPEVKLVINIELIKAKIKAAM
jgi:DNA-binding transcriptional MerR regulator